MQQLYNIPQDQPFDWTQFGQDISVFFGSIGSINFLYIFIIEFMYRSGNLYVSPEREEEVKEPKKKSEKRPREAIKESVAPQEMTTEEVNEVPFFVLLNCSLPKSHNLSISE